MDWQRVLKAWHEAKEAAAKRQRCTPLVLLEACVRGMGQDWGTVRRLWTKTEGTTQRERQASFELILNARALIQRGEFETPERLDGTAALLLRSLACRVGDGRAFRDATKDVLCQSLRYIVDRCTACTEFRCSGGRLDIVLPVRLEVLDRYPLWRNWCERFSVRSIVTEAKNTRRAAQFGDVGQLLHYLAGARLGSLGFLVSRNGFTKDAMESMREIAQENKGLIIPLDLCDLKVLLQLGSPALSMEFLRRKETDLLLHAA